MEITIDKQNLTPRIKKTGVLVYSELTNTLFIKSKNKGVMQIGSSSSSGDFVEKSTTIDINGVVQDLSTSRTWTIFVPTKTSELTNDSGFITTSALSGYELLSNKSTSTSLGTSDSLYPTQNAVKQYVDTGLSGKQNTLGYTAENSANKENTTLDTSTTKYPTNRLVKEAVDAKQDSITTGTTAQYFRGDLSLATFPTLVSSFTNDAGYITSSALSGYVPTTRTLTINGTTYDLSTDRTWSVGTVTSVAALTLGTTGTDLSSSVATGTTTPIITLNVPTASALNRGALSSTDWSTFNNKFTLPSLTAGSVLFSNGTTIAQDNANLFWDDTNNRLGVNMSGTAPTYNIDSVGTMRIRSSNSITATGGTITTVGPYTVHTFTTSGTFTPSGAGNMEVLVVGGGGGGGRGRGGGGGAGDYVYSASTAVLGQAYTITVGAGGAGGSSNNSVASSGSSSSALGLTAIGGGGGAGTVAFIGSALAGGSGASGGGGSGNGAVAGTGGSGGTATGINGRAGGSSYSDNNSYTVGGGGGGSSAVGSSPTSTAAGVGGAGTSNSISGSAVTYAGGGGGGGDGSATAGAGGAGGGGAGSTSSVGTAGTANTGGGGGGGASNQNGGAGGSGIVIIRYLTNVSTTLSTDTSGRVGIGQVTPSSLLTLAAGTTTAGTAPLKFTSGTNLTTAEAGVMEYNNTPHFTNSDATRRHIVLAPNTTKVTASAPYTNDGYITINIGGTDFKVMTTA